MNLRRTIASLLLVGSVLALNHLCRPFAESDGDRYFHLALDRIESTAGTIHTLPQAADLEWPKQFVDKEFLFHWVGRYAYRTGGEGAVLALPPILTSAILLLLLWIGSGWGGFWSVFVLEAVFVFLSPHFFSRIVLLRPHLLAILCYCGLVGGFVRSRPWLAFVSAALYGLAYHSFFVPLALLGVAFPIAAKNEKWKKAFLAGLIGFFMGMVLNPYFPDTLQVAFLVINEATNPEFNRLMETGAELLPLPIPLLMAWYFPHFLFAAGGSVLLWTSRLLREWKNPEYAYAFFLSILSLGLAAGMVRSPRTNEYLVPTIVLFGSAVIELLPEVAPRLHARRKLLAFVLAPLLLVYVYFGIPLGRSVLGYGEIVAAGLSDYMQQALAVIPRDGSEKKIFNCEWMTGSHILYYRPDLKFIDANAPDYLWLTDPQKVIARAKLNFGQAKDPYAIVSGKFHAQYALCIHPKAIETLDRDGRFERIFPEGVQEQPNPYFPFVYRVK